MARSLITSTLQDAISDDGAILFSVVQGEQLQFSLTMGWLTDLTGFTILPVATEASKSRDVATGYPTSVQPDGVVTTLPVIDSVLADNEFKWVIPEDLSALYTKQPTVNKPAYAFLSIEVSDTGVGDAQQTWIPVRGLIQILYSSTYGV